MRWLNYQHLFYFRTIAAEGGIARAAERLRLGQPTLSSQLRQLEEMVGRPLFERRNRKMVLTEAGKIALDYSNQIFNLGDELMEVLADENAAKQTHLQIGALDSVPKSVTKAVVMQALEMGPVTVSILEGRGDELFRELYAHRIDLILSNYPPPASESDQVFSKTVAKLPVAVYGAAKFKSLSKGFPKSLHGKPFVMPTLHSKLRHDLNHFFKVQGILVSTIAETQDTSLQRVLAGNGVGLAPLSETKADELEGLKKIGRLSGVHEEVWLISAQRKLENPVAARLMKTFALN